MNNVKIVTDSSANLPENLRQKLDITVVPLQAIFGKTVYRDGVDLTIDKFFEMLPTAKEHPTTSQPSAGEFAELYKPLLAAGKEIVSVHLSSKLSGTYASACAAKTELEQSIKAVPLTIVDTPWISLALGMLCIVAAQAAAAGKSRDDVVAAINAIIPKMNLIFVLDTLEYLKRGGRIGGASAMLGTLLNFKPMLEIKGGLVMPLEKPRSRAKAIKRLLEIMEQRTGGKKPVHVGILHAQAPEDAAALEKEIRHKYECKELYLSQIGPVLGVHTGPNALGLAFYAE